MSGIRSGKEREDDHDAKQEARLPVWRVLGVNRNGERPDGTAAFPRP
jgi:hypothetical protein